MRAYLIEEQSRSNELATPIDDDEDFDELAQEGEFGQDPADILAHREEMSGVNIRGLFPEQAIQEARADYRPFTWVDTQDICYGPLHITQCARQDVIVMEVPIRWKTLP